MIYADILFSSFLAAVLVKYTLSTLYVAPPHHQQQQQLVNLKIPPFWASNPEAWFGMVEGQFILCNITQDSLRFYYVLGALPESALRGLAL